MRFRVNSPQVISETIDGETIIIHLGTGIYYSFQDGARVWDAIADSASVAEIVDALERQYDADRGTIEEAVNQVVGELQAEDLVATTDGGADGHAELRVAADNGDRQPFRAPKLTKYTDMQDLVLLDPVHEVDQTGWPHTKASAEGA